MNEPRGPGMGGSQTDNAAQAYIAGRVKAGASNKAIIQELIQRGLDPVVAKRMVAGISRAHAFSARTSGLLFLIGGLLITAIFIAITIGSYETASQQGGTYFICFGAIFFGFILTLRGILQLIRGRDLK